MNQAFPQSEMQAIYGVCHYAIEVFYDIHFRGAVAGTEHLPREGGYIIAANHASLLDPPLIGCHVPRQLSFFARKTLWKGGIASWWLDAVGTIPVDRDAGSDIAAIKHVLHTLKQGKALILFPEGTRTPNGELQRPKAGVGLLACRTGVPVVPARIFGSFEAAGRNQPLRLGTPISVVFGRALPSSAYDVSADGKERYQRASERIMAAIGALQLPRTTVI